MAVDEAIFEMVAAGKSPPTLRFYTWNPPAISVGYFQDSFTDINIPACREMGIDVVRRLTGGRAVLHDKELTYSVICPESNPLFPETILGTYKIISSCLVKGLNSLGIKAMLTPLARRPSRTPSPSSPPVKGGEIVNSPLPWRERPVLSPPFSFDKLRTNGIEGVRVRGNKTAPSTCFTSLSNYEITVSGNKLIGSAQRRGDGAFIQHGSILTEFDRDRLEMVLPASGGLDGITSISEHLHIDMAELIPSLISSFEELLGISFSEGSLSDEEAALSKKYVEERYSRYDWNFRRPSQNL